MWGFFNFLFHTFCSQLAPFPPIPPPLSHSLSLSLALSSPVYPPPLFGRGTGDRATCRMSPLRVKVRLLLYAVLAKRGEDVLEKSLVRGNVGRVAVVVAVQRDVEQGLNLLVGKALAGSIVLALLFGFTL